ARATTYRHRAVVAALALATVPGFFEDPGREAFVVVGLVLAVWLPRLRVPSVLVGVLGVVAGSSLWVYLTHWQVYPHLEHRVPAAAVLASFVVGILVWRVAVRLERLVEAAPTRWRARQ